MRPVRLPLTPAQDRRMRENLLNALAVSDATLEAARLEREHIVRALAETEPPEPRRSARDRGAQRGWWIVPRSDAP